MNPSPEAIAVAAILFVVIAAYALFGGADFGGGIWDLLAGGTARGSAPRELIDESITPVWEANHVWLVFVLVLLWTAFPPAFAAIMTALFVPLALSLLGIVLRGVGFAFRHTAQRVRMQQLTGATFAAASLITPFFMGTVIGAVATGQVPVHPAGNVLAAWTSPTAILTGFLFVAACAYISAAFLVLEARQRGHQELARYFSLRATAAGVLTGALAGGTFAELSASSPHVFAGLTGRALPLVAISIAAGIAVLGMLWLRWYHAVFLRLAAAIAVATVVWGWGLAQYPYLFPTSLSLAAGSAPTGSLVAEFVVAGLAVLLVAPGFALLYFLQQRRMLTAAEGDADLRLAADLERAVPGQSAAAPAQAGAGVTALVLAMLAIRAIRNVFAPRRLPDPQRADRLADEVAPLVPHPGLVPGRRLGDGEPGAAEHPEGEPDQAVERGVAQVAAVDQVAQEALDQPVGVVLLAFAPAVPAERGRALQPDKPPVDRVAAMGEVGVQRQHRRLPGVRGARGRDDLRGDPGLLEIEHGLEEGPLAGEVVVHGATGDPAGRRDVFKGRARVPALGEQRGRLVQQRGPGGLRVKLAAALDLRHALSIVTNTEYVTSAEYVNRHGVLLVAALPHG